MSGCVFVTDDCIKLLLDKLYCSVGLKWLSVSGCELLTDKSLEYLQKFTKSLKHADFSGCFRMSGSGLQNFIDKCSNISQRISLTAATFLMDLIHQPPLVVRTL